MRRVMVVVVVAAVSLGALSAANRDRAKVITRGNVDADGRYNAFPGLTTNRSGDVVVVYRKAETHLSYDGRIVVRLSTNRGKSFGQPASIAETDGEDWRDPNVTRLSDGRLMLTAFARIDGHPSSVVRVWTSMDGRRWKIGPRVGAFGGYTATSGPVLEVGGVILMPVYGREGDDDHERFAVMRSVNGGKSWSRGGEFSLPDTNVNEATMLRHGRTVVAFVRQDGETAPVWRIESSDAGRTWDNAVRLFDVYPGRPAVTVDEGEMLMAYRQPKTALVAWRRSSDGGFHWGPESTLPWVSEYVAFAHVDGKLLAAVGIDQARIHIADILVTDVIR